MYPGSLEEVTGKQKKYTLQGLIIYTPLNITAIKSRMKWAAHVAHMGMCEIGPY
jgi:hypothetical protein